MATANPETQFEHELETFRREAETAVQFFYTWRSLNALAARDKTTLAALNKTPLFWNTALGALNTGTFIALGRVFDQDPNTHNIDRLLRLGQSNLQIFGPHALAERKRRLSASADDWLPEYLKHVYAPTPDDFRRLRRYVAKQRRVYESRYRPIRHNVFAHKHLTEKLNVTALFQVATIADLQKLLVFLRRLHQALWQLYFNGVRPLLRPARHSVSRMLDSPSSHSGELPERVVRETAAMLAIVERGASAK